MACETHSFRISTKPDELYNITDQVTECIRNSKIESGICLVFMAGSTGGISCLEFEPGLVKKDVKEMFQKLVPEGPNYAHHNTWGDHNGHSHLRSFLRPPSFCIPFNNNEPMLGTWQQIVFMEFDEKPRSREIICQIVG